MVRFITTAVLLVCSTVFGQAKFEEGMGKALGMWKSGQSTEASALFERIASAEKTNWLPYYYVAMVNCTEAFQPKNAEKASSLIEKAQKSLDLAKEMSPNNEELHVLQAMVYTATIVQDPMSNGMKYSPLAIAEYQKAIAINPNNPRAVFGKAEFELGGAKWTGADTKPLCAEITRSLDLFANFKPETSFHPNWGVDRAKQTASTCK
jgi:tetratricopeptide (TPR) repeat protein